MTIFDVNSELPTITEIRWTTEAHGNSQMYNLVKTEHGSVTVKEQGLRNMLGGGAALCETAEETRSLIKALEKAIDLGEVE